jgi:hypothetical protein
VPYGGATYDLNVVGKKDPNCGSGRCLTDYLLAIGWKQVSSVSAGTVCAVKGLFCRSRFFLFLLNEPPSANTGDTDWGHIIIGVGSGIIDAHNMAEHHASINDYSIDLCLSP